MTECTNQFLMLQVIDHTTILILSTVRLVDGSILITRGLSKYAKASRECRFDTKRLTVIVSKWIIPRALIGVTPTPLYARGTVQADR